MAGLDAACQVVRVKFSKGSQALSDKFRDLYVRSKVVKTLAHIYIENNVKDLGARAGVLKIHTLENCQSIEASLNMHVEERVNKLYPESEFGTRGRDFPGRASHRGSGTTTPRKRSVRRVRVRYEAKHHA